jgi:hypothetical protein
MGDAEYTPWSPLVIAEAGGLLCLAIALGELALDFPLSRE